jgi:uncharacterized protein
MTREEAIAVLRREKPHLVERYGVRQIGLFGSLARGEAGVESDIDVLVDVPINSVWDYLGLVDEVKAAFPSSVDVVRLQDGLRPRFRASIERDVIYA